jgi:hypothetical protein
MRSIRIAALFVLILVPMAYAQSGSPASQAAETITPKDVEARVEFLASDELKGRNTPSPGLETAAKYIADQFATLRLKPAGDSGTFIQRWPYSARTLNTANLKAELHGKTHHTLTLGQDYFLVPAPSVDSLVGDIVYAGVAGATTQATPALAGKIAVYYAPGGDMSAEWQRVVQTAVLAAFSSQVRGVIFILDPEFDADDVGHAVTNLGSATAPLPILAVRNDVARAWVTGSDLDLSVAATTPAEPKPVAGTSVRLLTGMTGSDSRPPNVVAILEGSDPTLKDTYVVFSAHMDHVGVGRPNQEGDSIYNGADDDASGTTAIIELAEAFASMQQRPKRSLIFLTVSGEEKGLYGSKYFVNNPPVPVEKMVANINLDMIGRNAPDTTVAIGQDYSSLGESLQAVVEAHPELKLRVAQDLWPEEKLFFRSDHFNFAVKKIPALFFTSGLHEDYHKPSDEADTIDTDKLARTAQLVFWLGHELANSTTVPSWTEAGLKALSPGN